MVEGVQPVERALRSGAPVEVLIVAPELVTGTGAAATVQAAIDAQVPVVRLTAELFTRLSDREGPTGVAAIVAIDERPLEQLAVGERSLFVALHEVANPGNLGTIVRTADSLGIDGVVVVGPSTDPYSPSAVKASMGSLFAVPVVHVATDRRPAVVGPGGPPVGGHDVGPGATRCSTTSPWRSPRSCCSATRGPGWRRTCSPPATSTCASRCSARRAR